MSEVRAFSVGFFGNAKHALNVLGSLGWCDTYYCDRNAGDLGGTPGSLANLQRLGIDYGKYNACLTYNDSMFDALTVLLEDCRKHGITVYANAHGYDKSVPQIKDSAPNPYAKYWNAMGSYWLDRYKTCTGQDPLSNRWISIGSLKDDFLHRNHSWDESKTNGKVLVLYEPDTDLCENDPVPMKPEKESRKTIEILKGMGVGFDVKLHPTWPEFTTYTGKRLWKPEGCGIVDFDLPEMRKYSLVIGYYSTTLLNAVAMGIPVINVAFDYPKAMASHWGPGELGLFPRCGVDELEGAVSRRLGRRMEYDSEKVRYFLGPLGGVAEDYRRFIEDDLRSPRARLGVHHSLWQWELWLFRIKPHLQHLAVFKIARQCLRLYREPGKARKLFDADTWRWFLRHLREDR